MKLSGKIISNLNVARHYVRGTDKKGGNKMTARSKVFTPIVAASAVITAANLVIIQFFAWSGASQAPEGGAVAIFSLRQVFL